MIPPRPAVPEIGAATSKARIGSVHLPRACIKNCIPTINGAFHRNLTTCVHRIRSLQLGLDTIEKLCCKSFCRTLHQARPHAVDLFCEMRLTPPNGGGTSIDLQSDVVVSGP